MPNLPSTHVDNVALRQAPRTCPLCALAPDTRRVFADDEQRTEASGGSGDSGIVTWSWAGTTSCRVKRLGKLCCIHHGRLSHVCIILEANGVVPWVQGDDLSSIRSYRRSTAPKAHANMLNRNSTSHAPQSGVTAREEYVTELLHSAKPKRLRQVSSVDYRPAKHINRRSSLKKVIERSSAILPKIPTMAKIVLPRQCQMTGRMSRHLA